MLLEGTSTTPCQRPLFPGSMHHVNTQIHEEARPGTIFVSWGIPTISSLEYITFMCVEVKIYIESSCCI